MLTPDQHLTIAHLPIAALSITEVQPRNPERVLHYYHLLLAHPTYHPGLVSVAPVGDGRYTILDGHHRMLACIMAGRSHVLALVVADAATGQRVPIAC